MWGLYVVGDGFFASAALAGFGRGLCDSRAAIAVNGKRGPDGVASRGRRPAGFARLRAG